jgi:hypothetical protein
MECIHTWTSKKQFTSEHKTMLKTTFPKKLLLTYAILTHFIKYLEITYNFLDLLPVDYLSP